MRDAREWPFQRGKCATCGAAIIEPAAVSSSGRGVPKGEGQWLHVELPERGHPAAPHRQPAGETRPFDSTSGHAELPQMQMKGFR